MNSRRFFLAKLACLVGLSATAQDKPTRHADDDITLEQIRAGLERNWELIKNLHVRISRTPFMKSLGEEAPDHPDRMVIEVFQTSDGNWLERWDSHKNGVLSNMSVHAFDGQLVTTIGDERQSQFSRHAEMAVTTPPRTGVNYDRTFPTRTSPQEFPLMRLESNEPYHRSVAANAQLIGPVDVDGVRCVRVETENRKGYDAPHRLFIDVDPAKGFWPRRVQEHFPPNPRDNSTSVSTQQILEFIEVDGHWYPKVTSRHFAAIGKWLFAYTLEVELNPSLPIETFRPQPQLGRSYILKDSTGNGSLGVFIAGGEAGRREFQRQHPSGPRRPLHALQGIRRQESPSALSTFLHDRAVPITSATVAVACLVGIGLLMFLQKRRVRPPDRP